MPNSTEWISPKEAAQIAGVTQKTIWNWIKAGLVPASQIGERGQYRLDLEEFERYIQTRRLTDEE